MRRFAFLLIISFWLTSFTANSQVYNIGVYNGQTVTTCSGTFYDTGGPSGNYVGGEVKTMTFCPSTTGGFIRLTFTQWKVTAGDQLEIFDGPSTASPSFGSLNTTISPIGMIIGASLLNASGCITLRWTSYGSDSGWVANVNCGLPCQSFQAGLLSSIPPFHIDSNIYYIDICHGDTVKLIGTGIFPNNNQYYHQSNTTSSFFWNFGQGSSATGQYASYYYDTIRGYNIRLKIYDTLGCMNSNAPEIRVRISTKPNFKGTTISAHDICEGDTAFLKGKVNPKSWKANSSLATAGTTYLPDGSGASYTSTLVFNTFLPGQQLTNPANLLAVCANIEHSYLGDLHITLSCPTGQTVVLKQYPGGTNTFLGEPIDDTNGGGPGVGYDYCWRPSGTTTMLGAAGTYYHAYTDVLGQYYPNAAFIPPSTNYPPASTAGGPFPILNYQPVSPFSTFLGCPLNGAWTITVTDNLAIDDGYIFNWGLTFSPNILPVSWGYTPQFTSAWQPHPSIVTTSGNNIAVKPTPGNYTYTFHATDNFGCSYDTTVTLSVVPQPKVDLGNDTTICDGSIIMLDAGQNTGGTYLWSTGGTTQYQPVNVTGVYSVTLFNGNGVITCSNSDTVTVIVAPLPKVNLGADTCSPVAITLDADNPGYFYQWSTGATSKTITVTQSGTYTVTVTLAPGTVCYKVDTINVKIIPDPVVDLGNDFEMCRHQSKVLSAKQGDYPYSYHWSPGGQTSSYIVINRPELGPHVIQVTVTGCNSVTDEVNYMVNPCQLKIPNIITPNSDGFNERFVIENLEYYPGSTIVIFNRWGKKVFESTNYLNDWDAKDNVDGVFYYILKLNDGENTEYSGTVSVMR